MANQGINNLLNDPRTNLGYIVIVVILGFLAGGGILGYYSWWIAEQEAKFAEFPEIKLAEKVTKDKTTDWQTYINEKYSYEIKYPPLEGFDLRLINRKLRVPLNESNNVQIHYSKKIPYDPVTGSTIELKSIYIRSDVSEEKKEVIQKASVQKENIQVGAIKGVKYFLKEGQDIGEFADFAPTVVVLFDFAGKDYYIRFSPNPSLELEELFT